MIKNLHYRGIQIDFNDLLTNSVAIIGSRKATNLELEKAYYLAQRSVKAGKIVVSGLAVGIDAAAHQGAVDAGGVTIAIVNTPSSQPIYPVINRTLAASIENNGGIIFPYIDKSEENNPEEKGLSQFSKRLIERDILLSYICPAIVTVKEDDTPIDGGTKWGYNYGEIYGKKLFRMNTEDKFFENPTYKKSKVWWDMELNQVEFVKSLKKYIVE